VKAEYKVYAAKVGEGDDYTMDHSSFIYFMTPNDQLIALFKTQQTSDEIEDFIRKYLKKNGGQ
jgi:cytochrome oxidase Cu insertion factor (SCO1/SenC/PrrC family)